jgi:hypothetical protein
MLMLLSKLISITLLKICGDFAPRLIPRRLLNPKFVAVYFVGSHEKEDLVTEAGLSQT